MSSGDYNPNAGCPAAFKLLGHVLQKGVEAGGLLGAALIAPGTAAYAKYGQKKEVDPLQLLENVAWSAAIGGGLSAILGSAKLLQMDQAGLEDRVYRLHFSESQKRCDAFSLVGTLTGVAAAAYLFQGDSRVRPLHYLGAGGAGAAAGVLLHVLTRPQGHKTPNKMLHELVN